MDNEKVDSPKEKFIDAKDAIWQARLEEIKDRKEERLLSYQQDCRRTALQLAERITKGDSLGVNPMEVIVNAEILYCWLTESSKDAVDTFIKMGVLKFPTT